MRIIFFGADGWFSEPVLSALAAAGHEVLLVVSKGEVAAKFKVQSSKFKIVEAKTAEDISIKKMATMVEMAKMAKNGYSDYNSPNHYSHSSHSFIPDAIVLASFGPPFLANEVLKWPKYGCLNVHASLLPRWRGASPVFSALSAGDKETGVSIMRMTEKIDRGPVLGQKKTVIKSGVSWRRQETPDNRETLTKRLGKLGGELIVETLKKLETGQITEVRQPIKSPTPYTRKLTKESGRIDWSQSPIQIERFIRAVTPWPGAWTEFRAKGQGLKAKGKTIKILKAHLAIENNEQKTMSNEGKALNLIIDSVQLPGKNPVTWKQFLTGHPNITLVHGPKKSKSRA